MDIAVNGDDDEAALITAREKEAALFKRRRETFGIVRLLPAIENC